MIGGGASPPAHTHYLFVDAASLLGYLEKFSARYFGGEAFAIDFAKLVPGFSKVFYYDALPVRDTNEDEDTYEKRIAPKKLTLESARNTDFVHVYEGDARRRRRRGGLEQKKIDVAITVDMLSYAFRGRMTHATLLTGDGDFKPLVDALVHESVEVTLWYPPNETSRDLMNAADIRRPLCPRTLRELLDQDSRDRFEVPMPINLDPAIRPSSDCVGVWVQNGLGHALYRGGDGFYTLTRNHSALNTLHTGHSNFDLLLEYARDSLGIVVPAEVSERAKR